MKIFLTLLTVSLLTLSPLYLLFTSDANANQIWETVVGDPNAQSDGGSGDGGSGGGGSGGGGGGSGDDGLGAGVIKPPFKCGLRYWGLTYPNHTGWAVDFNRGSGTDDAGDPVRAAADGRVSHLVRSNGQMGITHEGGYITTYAHMRNLRVGVGERVRQGQRIGDISNTYFKGTYISPHLHFQMARSSFTNTQKIKFPKNGFANGFPASLPAGSSYSRLTPKVAGPCN